MWSHEPTPVPCARTSKCLATAAQPPSHPHLSSHPSGTSHCEESYRSCLSGRNRSYLNQETKLTYPSMCLLITNWPTCAEELLLVALLFCLPPPLLTFSLHVPHSEHSALPLSHMSPLNSGHYPVLAGQNKVNTKATLNPLVESSNSVGTALLATLPFKS